MRFLLFALLVTFPLLAQIDTQNRYSCDSRQYFVWNETSSSYLLQESEFEHSYIDIREIGSKSSGYIAISLVDNGRARLFHGSIAGFSVNEKKEGTWQMRSKTMKGKLTYNADKNEFTFLYDANEKRFQRIFIFSVKNEDEVSNAD